MKYGKLVEIRKKARIYETILDISFLIGIAVSVLLICFVYKGMQTNTWLYVGIAVAFLFAIMSIVFTRLEGRQNRMADDYFVIRIMGILNEQGYESDKFEIIEESRWSYRIGFHNQTVDYEKLQAVIDKEVFDMCKIMKHSIRVKLI